MLQMLIKKSAVRLFALVARSGMHRLPVIDRGFLALYTAYKRYVEAGPIEGLREFVPEGSMVIDVGANVGFFSVQFARWVGASGKVISIEPEDRNYEVLVSALKRKGLEGRVQALKAVAAATADPTFLEINELHPADHKHSRDGTGIAVDAVTLENVVEEKGALSPGLIKIDVQGAEMLVLQGAADVLRLARPALFVELDENALRKFGTSVSAILNYLAEYGYEPYWLRPFGSHDKADAAEIGARIDQNGYVDVLFLIRSGVPPGNTASPTRPGMILHQG
jgi:FkbM family methyltransferase